jgi:hypothetical protein
MDTYITNSFCKKLVKYSDTLAQVFNCICWSIFPFIICIFCCTWCIDRYTDKIIHILLILHFVYWISCGLHAYQILFKFPVPHNMLSTPALSSTVRSYAGKLARMLLCQNSNFQFNQHLQTTHEHSNLVFCLNVVVGTVQHGHPITKEMNIFTIMRYTSWYNAGLNTFWLPGHCGHYILYSDI